MHIHRRNVLSLTLALNRMRSDNIAIMSRDPLWCDSRLMYCRSNWCLVIFSNKGNHYERLSLRASLVLPHHTTQSIMCAGIGQDVVLSISSGWCDVGGGWNAG